MSRRLSAPAHTLGEHLRRHLPEANDREGGLMEFIGHAWNHIPIGMREKFNDWTEATYGYRFRPEVRMSEEYSEEAFVQRLRDYDSGRRSMIDPLSDPLVQEGIRRRMNLPGLMQPGTTCPGCGGPCDEIVEEVTGVTFGSGDTFHRVSTVELHENGRVVTHDGPAGIHRRRRE